MESSRDWMIACFNQSFFSEFRYQLDSSSTTCKPSCEASDRVVDVAWKLLTKRKDTIHKIKIWDFINIEFSPSIYEAQNDPILCCILGVAKHA